MPAAAGGRTVLNRSRERQMRIKREPAIQIKTRAQLDIMREAGLLVAQTLNALAAAAKPGVTTEDLDQIAERQITGAGATPSFRGWHADPALTVGVGEISDDRRRLLEACEEALWQGLAEAYPGRRLSDISHAVERSARAAGPY